MKRNIFKKLSANEEAVSKFDQLIKMYCSTPRGFLAQPENAFLFVCKCRQALMLQKVDEKIKLSIFTLRHRLSCHRFQCFII